MHRELTHPRGEDFGPGQINLETNTIWIEMNFENWEDTYITFKGNLSPMQIELLQYGPKTLAQSYELVRMKDVYMRYMKRAEI
jgi:hypothetical protein